MEVVLLSVGKVSSSWILNGITEFQSRLGKYVKFQSKEIPDIKKAASFSPDKLKSEEGKAIVEELSVSDLVVLFDEKGKEFTSLDFASWMEKQMASGRKRLVFIIGGPFGFSEEVYKRADFKMALSKLTFTHEMAKLFAIEQFYRAMTILRGEPYHHE